MKKLNNILKVLFILMMGLTFHVEGTSITCSQVERLKKIDSAESIDSITEIGEIKEMLTKMEEKKNQINKKILKLREKEALFSAKKIIDNEE